jgi:hypothetical protein
MSFNFGDVLSHAWQVVWKRRVLWIFGMLASCSSGGTNFNWSMNSGNGGGFNGGEPNLPPQAEQLLEYLTQNAVSIATIAISVICIFVIVAIFLGAIGRVGLIRGTWLSETGGNVAFGSLFSESMPFFWRVFGLSLLVSLPFVFVIGALVAGMIALGVGAAASQGNSPTLLGLLAFVPVFLVCLCLLIPIGFVISLIVRQAERAIVLENLGVLPALSRGWDIFRNNLGPLILMALILAVISLVVGFVVAIPVLLVVLPTTLVFMAGSMAGRGPNWNAMGLALACTCLLTPVLWLINGILMAYLESAWTLAYMQITRPLDITPVTLEANA